MVDVNVNNDKWRVETKAFDGVRLSTITSDTDEWKTLRNLFAL